MSDGASQPHCPHDVVKWKPSRVGPNGEYRARWCCANCNEEFAPKAHMDRAPKNYPWWRKDRMGWPIETVEGRWIQNAIRIFILNIRKVTG